MNWYDRLLLPEFCHLHRVVSSGHSKVVLDQLCCRGERKLEKVHQIKILTGSIKTDCALHSKQLFWIASPPLWLQVAFQQRPRPACCLCRSHQPGAEKYSFFFYFQINFQSSLHSQPGSLYRKSSLDWIHPEKKEQWLEIKMNPIVPGKWEAESSSYPSPRLSQRPPPLHHLRQLLRWGSAWWGCEVLRLILLHVSFTLDWLGASSYF